MTETLPFDIPGYIVQGLIGKGGMGRVYRAEQLTTHRPVAIKLLTMGSVDESRLRGFRHEAATLGQLEHPHIVPLYDFGEHNGVPYLVVRFLSGGTVADRLKSGPIEINTALRWITDVADALDTAHRRGIIHRDVKPSNLLLDEIDNIYLGDFGIAATMVDLQAAPRSGSAAYASPEQARGEAPVARSDIYSLAATTFEMLTGKKPYEADTALGMMVRHMNDPIPSPRMLLPTLPAAVDAAIVAGMAKLPQDRPKSAGDFALNIQCGAGTTDVADLETIAVPTVDDRPARRFSRTWMVGVGLAATALCLVGLGIVGGGIARRVSSPTAAATSSKLEPTAASAVTTVPAARAIPFADGFSDPSSGFATSQDSDGQVGYIDGQLQIKVQPGIEWYSPYRGLEQQDLAITVQVRQLAGPLLSEMGVICRWQDKDNYVAAALRGDGMVSLWRMISGTQERWQDWTSVGGSATVGLDWRTLRLICQGTHISFAIDGTQVAAADDPAPASGTLALMAGLFELGELTVAFDELQVDLP